MNSVKILSELFRKKYGRLPEDINRLAGAGSGRIYYRLRSGEDSCIGVEGENERDCRAFVCLTKAFRGVGIGVPELYEVSEDGLYYIQEDLGDKSLFSLIKEETKTCGERKEGSEEYYGGVRDLVKEALHELARMQCTPTEVWEDFVEYRPFSHRQILWDLNYFKYEYLKPAGIDFDEERLEDDFEKMADRLLSISNKAEGFMYRDFQSRNVMVKDGKCRFIDYQGGRQGPAVYDAISFLWQARAGFTKEFRNDMLESYARSYCGFSNVDIKEIIEGSGPFVLFRTLQVLGAYGLRGLVERKAHFIESIPAALANLKDLIDDGELADYPELTGVARKLVEDPRFAKDKDKTGDGEKNESPLTIEVWSFSYKKGYPENFTGNGGGFMFDCRGMHNPGRYPEYKTLTGMDRPVIEFLKEKGETDIFSDRALELIRPTVERYIKRGFSNLQIGFGCTGGQHRSVYCAERVSQKLAEEFPEAKIVVCHREQGKTKTYNDRNKK
ncbi:MAG: phosphotransferase [Muribaculaceae bacterium]|nr:phosphotransferase [Muribaculaceae bacterium]